MKTASHGIVRGWGFGVMMVLATSAAAQHPAPPPPPAPAAAALRVNVNLVNMLFTVRDADGRLVKDLRAGQFRVTDNGQAQPIAYFSEESDQPLALAVALDKSSSVEGHFDFERRATLDFVRSVLRPGKDHALLITFDKKPHLAVGFTDRAEDFAQAMAALTPEGGTALYDAARVAIASHFSKAGSERKVLVLVTDGEDTVSWTTLREVLALALSNNVVVYTLGVKPDAPGSNPGAARSDLVRLSDETGGLALFPKDNPGELAGLFDRIENDMRHQYSLGYALPPSGENAFHQVMIEPTDRAYRVRTRRGYYNSDSALPEQPSVSH